MLEGLRREMEGVRKEVVRMEGEGQQESGVVAWLEEKVGLWRKKWEKGAEEG